MEENFIEMLCSDNNLSESHFKNFFERVIYDDGGHPLNGKIEIGIYPYATIRFHNGMIDGNLYDNEGNILNRYPAIEYQYYSSHYVEYWTKGFPDGLTAISVDDGVYVESWMNKKLVKILKKDWFPPEYVEFEGNNCDENGQFTYKIIFEDIDSMIYNESRFITEPIFNTEIIKEIDEILSYDNNLSFPDRLIEIMRTKRFKDPQVYRRIDMPENIFNKIKNGKQDSSISYEKAIMLAFGLELTFDQMIKFVNFARKGFRNDSERDKIVREFIEAGNYDMLELNETLFKKKLKLFRIQKKSKKTESSNKKTSTKKKDDKKSSKEKIQ